MRVIITMAGESSRFKKAGYLLPKYKLICRGKTMFEWSLSSLERWFSKYHFTFVLREDEWFVNDMCRKLNIKSWDIVRLEHLTSGQAETVVHALNNQQDEEIAIFNIDTYVKGLSEFEIPLNIDGWIPVFSAKGNHWSFTIANEQNEIIDIEEKVRISEWATVGLYYFSSSKKFVNYYHLTYPSQTLIETYIAPIYKRMLNDGALLKQTVLKTENIIPLGTPNEVLIFDPLFEEVNK